MDRANRGLLTEAPATEEADASRATATQWRSANGTCIHEPTTGAIRPEKDEVGAVGWRKRVLTVRSKPDM